MSRAKPIMIQGTMSNAGKSLICAALCRIFARKGVKAAPFKSQNMALNSFITSDGLEMGRAQAVQAEAAGIEPDVRMNPILLKPTTDVGSQVIVNGEVRGNMRAVDYFRRKKDLIPDIMRAYDSLANEYDVIVVEGAGSPAEINLKKDDVVNMGLAKLIGAPVLLVGDIDRGGVFAQLYGTVELLDPDERSLVKATVINKFRGDVEILKPGLKMLEDLVRVPCAGVVPYVDVDVDDEDSQSERLLSRERKDVDVAVIKLPKMSNYTDFSPLARYPFVSLRYVERLGDLGSPDMIILPGTKSTIADLKWLRESGFEAAVKKAASRTISVFGICGGLQMLGKTVSDPSGVEGGGSVAGIGLLPITTVFSEKKTRLRKKGVFRGVSGVFERLNGIAYEGYEIHSGVSDNESDLVIDGNVYGSYVHGLFDADGVADAIISALCDKRGIRFDASAEFDVKAYREAQYDKLADAVENALDMELIYKILEEGA